MYNAYYLHYLIILLLMDIHSSFIAAASLSNLLASVEEQIEHIQLIKKMPKFIHADMIVKINFQFQASECDHQSRLTKGMIEQHLDEVLLLPKDSLMPKGIEKQSQQLDKVDKLESSIVKKRKGMNNTRSSFNRSNINSMQNTNRNSKISSFSKNKKKVDENLISLQSYIEDPEIEKLWKLKDSQIQIKQKQRKAEQAKKKSFEEKKQNFKNQFVEKGYTFDFQGDPVTSTQDEDKINYYGMKMKMSLMDKKLRSNINFKDKDSIIDVKVQRKPSIGNSQHSLSVQFAAIPVFQNPSSGDSAAIFGLPSEMSKCKLKQYKKHYGGRFSRIDKSLNTIDTPSQKNDEYNQIFSQRRYLKDQQRTINESMVSYRTRIDQATRRKLALPKIHGKYSTLDRYQQF